ncbi:glycerophosphodiester phosphodiesterase [Nocardioides sp. ChNu-153]|uniref:glycerophosphodiester phosphodiesterase n=1 Tax=unclassified Nocardioides TaxID=2615069 RepID=UPI002404C6D2|nr:MULTISPECIES: glycerophosphodiester phosphodiesterase family protein [unclassified Nocardioides]MDF9714885.1 glycerophosphodiester phosphodiesterase [Nocardioides sp. ChNu-99]MDN7123114.1 glycerophosphodiester phosphodiesterase [Nocardioides sp. ChNu-153]
MRPLVVAHRGATDVAAEHTLGAFVAALDAGADGLECDVRLTADGHLVLVHDRFLPRPGRRPGIVSTMELADLHELDVAARHRPWTVLGDEAPDLDPAEHGVLTLRRLMEVAADHARPVELAIETKHPTRYGGLVERRLVELLRDFGWDGADAPVRVLSFSHTALQRVRRLAPDLRVVQLFEQAHYWPALRRMIGSDWGVGPGIDELSEHPGLAERLALGPHEVHVWTVNDRAQLDLCRHIGAHAVITDRPRALRELVDAAPT